MDNFTFDFDQKWAYENGFYLSSQPDRLGKLLNHYEIYQHILGLNGDIAEFGVFKGVSLVQLLTFRDLLETPYTRKVYGFDAFGKFPADLQLEGDKEFVKKFEGQAGFGISKELLNESLSHKGFTNYELIQGDILKTLPKFLKQNPHVRFSLLHIDVDVYEPTKVILETCYDLLVRGGVLMLDDYGTIEGETKAVDEFFSDRAQSNIYQAPFAKIPAYLIKQ